MIFTRDIYVLGTWNLYLEREGALPLFTELPRRRVWYENRVATGRSLLIQSLVSVL